MKLQNTIQSVTNWFLMQKHITTYSTIDTCTVLFHVYSELALSLSVILTTHDRDKDYANVQQITLVLGKFTGIGWRYREDSLWFLTHSRCLSEKKKVKPRRRRLYTSVTFCLIWLFPPPPRSVLIGWSLAGRINSHLPLLPHLISWPCKTKYGC